MEKVFFDLPVKNEEEAYEKIISDDRNNDYTTGNLLDFAYFKESYRLIAIDLSKQTKLKDPQQISFIGKLENEVHRAIRRDYFWIFTKMETQKIVNLLNSSEKDYSKFATKKWYVIGRESKSGYSRNDPIKFLKVNRIKSLWLFWCIYFNYRKYCCYKNYCYCRR